MRRCFRRRILWRGLNWDRFRSTYLIELFGERSQFPDRREKTLSPVLRGHRVQFQETANERNITRRISGLRRHVSRYVGSQGTKTTTKYSQTFEKTFDEGN